MYINSIFGTFKPQKNPQTSSLASYSVGSKSRTSSSNGVVEGAENMNSIKSPQKSAKKSQTRFSNGLPERLYMPDNGIQRDNTAEVLASLSNSSRLRWTPKSKSFVMVERTGNSSYEVLDDEAYTRDRIVLLPTRRARDLSRFRPRPSTSSTVPPIHGEMDISMLDDDDFNRGPTPPIEYESDHQIENSPPGTQQSTAKSPKSMQRSPQQTAQRSPRQPAQRSPQQTAQRSSQQTVQRSSQLPVRQSPQQTAQRSPQQTAQRSPQQLVQRSSQQHVRQSPQQTAQRSPQQTAQRSSQLTVQRSSQQPVRQSPQQTAQPLPQQPVLQSPQKQSKSPRKTILTPVKDRFAPISSSPLARQIDDEESQLLDAEWNANDDMLLLTPVPATKKQSRGSESAKSTPKQTPASIAQKNLPVKAANAIDQEVTQANSPLPRRTTEDQTSKTPPTIVSQRDNVHLPRSLGTTPQSHKTRSFLHDTPRRGHSTILGKSIDINPTPSPRRRLQTEIVEERRRSQSPGKGTPTNSSMVLTSPYRGSDRSTSFATPSKHLRNLLDAHYENLERESNASNHSIRSNRSKQNVSQEPTPTKALRTVSGRITTPHPYRLHTLRELQEEEAAVAAAAAATTPKAKISPKKLVTTSGARQSNASQVHERDLSTILAEEDSSSNYEVDLTYIREADEQERVAEKHIPRYRKSTENIFNQMQKYISSDGDRNQQRATTQQASSSPITERVSSPSKQLPLTGNNNRGEDDQNNGDDPESEDEEEEEEDDDDEVNDDEGEEEADDDEKELHDLREWSRQDAGVQEEINAGDDWHASSRYEEQSEEEDEEDLNEEDEEDLNEEDEEDLDEEEENIYESSEEEEEEEEEEKIAGKEESDHVSIVEEIEEEENFDADKRTNLNIVAEEEENQSEEEIYEEDAMLHHEENQQNHDSEAASQSVDDDAQHQEDRLNDGIHHYQDHRADRERGYDHEAEADIYDREGSTPLAIDVADSPYAREKDEVQEEEDEEVEEGDWIEELDNQMSRHLSAPLTDQQERYESESVGSDRIHLIQDHPSMSEYLLNPDELIEDPDASSEEGVILLDEGDQQQQQEYVMRVRQEAGIDEEEEAEVEYEEQEQIENGAEEGEDERFPSDQNHDDDIEDVYGARSEDIQRTQHHTRASEVMQNDLQRRQSSKTVRLSNAHQDRYAKVSEWHSPSINKSSRRSDQVGESDRAINTRPAKTSGTSRSVRQEPSNVMMNESHGSMTLSNVMRHRANMLASRPTMVEVTSMDRDAAARAAEILRAHHKYVQYGMLEADLDEDSFNHTIMVESQQERSITKKPVQVMRSAEKVRTPRLSRRSDERHSFIDIVPSPANPATPHSHGSVIANTPLLPGAFPGSSGRQSRRLSNLNDDHAGSELPDLTTFSDVKWKQLSDFVDAEIIDRANSLRDLSIISKSEALLRAATIVNRNAIAIEFLEKNNIFDHAQLHQWSEKRMVRRITILIKNFVVKLQQRYPHLDVNLEAITSNAETAEEITNPATPLRRNNTIDESGIARTAERVPFRMIVESTPAQPSSPLRQVTFADSSDSMEPIMQNIYPALPSAHKKRKPNVMDETEATEDNVETGIALTSVADSSYSAAKWASQGISMLGSIFEGFLSRGRNQNEQSVHEPVEEQVDTDEIPMREAYEDSNPISITRSRTLPEEIVDRQRGIATSIPLRVLGDDLRVRHVNLQSALQSTYSRNADMNDEPTRSSVRTGKKWHPPAEPTRLMNDNSSMLPSNASRTLTISRTPVRRITSGSSSYVHPTALSMLSPQTHAEARLKVNEFRNSRAGRKWRSPKPMRDTTSNSFSRSAELTRTGFESKRRNNNTINTTTDNTSHPSTTFQSRNVGTSQSYINRPSSSKRSRQV